MAVTYGSAGSIGTGTTSANPTYPSGISASTSVLIAVAWGRSSVAGTAITPPAGWFAITQHEAGVGTFGMDTGSRRTSFYRKPSVVGDETGSVGDFEFLAGDSTSTLAVMVLRFEKTAGYSINVSSTYRAAAQDLTRDTSYSATSSTSFQYSVGDILAAAVCLDNSLALSSNRVFTANNVTFDVGSTLSDAAVVTGNNCRRHFRMAEVLAVGPSPVTTTYSFTTSDNASGPCSLFLIHEFNPNVSVGLTGQAITSSPGSFAPRMYGGRQANFSAGSLGNSRTVGLLGQVASFSPGVIIPLKRGQVATFAQGSITAVDFTRALTGSAITSTSGTLTKSSGQPALVGQAITVGQGTLSIVGSPPVTVHITGEELTFEQGTLERGGQLIAGSASTTATGTLSRSVEVPIDGEGINSALGLIFANQDADDTVIRPFQGAFSPDRSIPLVGTAIITFTGAVGASRNAVFALTGEAITSSPGTMGFSKAQELAGEEAEFFQYNVGAPGGAALSGQAVSVIPGQVFTTTDRSFALTGSEMTLSTGDCFASPLAFVSGTDLLVGQGNLSEPRSREILGSGIVDFTGTGPLHPGREIILSAGGSLTLSGQKGLSWDKHMASGGALLFSGTSPTLFFPLGIVPIRQRAITGYGL